ncbi:MAG: phenol hydroxylase [Polaromonas sp.]|nr:phenol hydroxylase [Polaromonas sp.]
MAPEDFDVSRKFVRILRTLPNGLIEFEFSIGEPDVAVELIMPKAAFDAFCRDNRVEFIAADAPRAGGPEADDFNWSLQQATHQRFK